MARYWTRNAARWDFRFRSAEPPIWSASHATVDASSAWAKDPILIGKMLAAELRATQEQGVIANINRFAVNDQETERQRYNVDMDERTLRETDLLVFEIAIKQSDVGTVMGAYSRLNGVYCCENRYLLTDVLKKALGSCRTGAAPTAL
jgi:beta-glucosidase-like glycosyl hydrolase